MKEHTTDKHKQMLKDRTPSGSHVKIQTRRGGTTFNVAIFSFREMIGVFVALCSSTDVLCTHRSERALPEQGLELEVLLQGYNP